MADKAQLSRVEIRYMPKAQVGKLFMKAQMGDPAAFLPPHEMEPVDMPGMAAEIRAVNHPKNLRTIFKHYQRIDDTPDERTKQISIRSMTVGDAIVIKGKAYYVIDDDGIFAVKSESGELIELTEENFTTL